MGGFKFRLCTYKFPPGSSDSAPKPEAEGRVWWDGWDGLDGLDGISKGSFNFLQTLWEYRTCIYILVYKIKVAANILMGFKIWCQVGVWVTLFSKLPYSREFSNIWFQKSTDIRYKRSLSTIFWKFQKAISIWVLVGGFNFRLCTYKFPPGSSDSASKPEAEGRVWWGRMGSDGTVIKSVL